MDENPYQPPASPLESRGKIRLRWPNLVELLVIAAIIFVLWALLQPAVQSGPHHRRHPAKADEQESPVQE